ncbi:hypothetical protein [Rothia kristinae]|uniref:hypothetical protein n=1 Tax=Rothia kristinae TaxID=37923 RepID=UPI00244AB5DC|nr:hypothetical protein [Rothia kristinae]WGH09803.1 hypothetical protein OU799_02525 [Rothia kristinae]
MELMDRRRVKAMSVMMALAGSLTSSREMDPRDAPEEQERKNRKKTASARICRSLCFTFLIMVVLLAFPGLKMYNDYNERHFTIRSCKIISAKPCSGKGGVGKASFTAGAGVSVRTEDCGKFALDT